MKIKKINKPRASVRLPRTSLRSRSSARVLISDKSAATKGQQVRITCIIPTMNRSEFLKEALESVFKQTMKPFEIAVVNNGELPIVFSENMETNVTVYNIVFRAGASQARNFGASVAKGDYLAFLDDDDLWSEQYLEKAVEAIKNGAECVLSRLDKMVGSEVRSYKNAFGKLSVEKLLTANPGVTGSNIVIKKDLFMKLGGFDPELPTSNDKDFMIRVLNSSPKIMILGDSQAIYREHEGEKITNPQKSARGVRRFTEKYSRHMNKSAYFINRTKYFKYRIQGGEKRFYPQYLFYSFANKIFKYV